MNKPFFAGFFVSLFFSQMPLDGKSQINSNPTTGVVSVQYGVWSSVTNPAGIAPEKSLATGFYYQSAFLMHELADAGFALSYPAGKFSVVGLSYQQYGYSLYKEQKAGLVLAKQLGKPVSAGIRFDYLSIGFGNDYGKTSLVTGSAGVIVKVTDELRVGVYVYNPQRVKYSKETDVRLPALISGGLAWRFGKHVELLLGAEKRTNSKEKITCGIEYVVSDRFQLIAGAGTGNKPFYFGYAFRKGRIELAMTSGYHELLGFSPQILLTCKNFKNE